MTKQKLLISLKLLMYLKKQVQHNKEVANQELIPRLLVVIEKLSSEYKTSVNTANSGSDFTFGSTTVPNQSLSDKKEETITSSEGIAQLQSENEILKFDLKEKSDLLEKFEKQYRIVLEQVESYSSMMEMTINYVNGQLSEAKSTYDTLEKVNAELEDNNNKLKAREAYFEEFLESKDQMFKMTLDYMGQELTKTTGESNLYKEAYQEDLQNSLQFTHELTSKYFDAKKQLANLFSKSLYFSYPDSEYHSNVFFVIEKFGITYLVMVKADLEGLERETFAMVSSFALNSIIKVKKYINSSKLIDEYFLSIEPALMMLNTLKNNELDVAVCLLDTANYEVEFASTGLPIYSVSGSKLTSYFSGESNNHSESLRSVGLRNKYKIEKIGFNKNTSLLFSSESLVDKDTKEQNELGKVVESSFALNEEQQKEALQAHCSQEQANVQGLLIVGMSF